MNIVSTIVFCQSLTTLRVQYIEIHIEDENK